MASKLTEEFYRLAESNLCCDQLAEAHSRRLGKAKGQLEPRQDSEGISTGELTEMMAELDEEIERTRSTKLVLKIPQHILTPLPEESASAGGKIDPELERRAQQFFTRFNNNAAAAVLENEDLIAEAQAFLQQQQLEAGDPQDPHERDLVAGHATLFITALRLKAEANQCPCVKTQTCLLDQALKMEAEARRQAVALGKYRKAEGTSKAAPLGWPENSVPSSSNGS